MRRKHAKASPKGIGSQAHWNAVCEADFFGNLIWELFIIIIRFVRRNSFDVRIVSKLLWKASMLSFIHHSHSTLLQAYAFRFFHSSPRYSDSADNLCFLPEWFPLWTRHCFEHSLALIFIPSDFLVFLYQNFLCQLLIASQLSKALDLNLFPRFFTSINTFLRSKLELNFFRPYTWKIDNQVIFIEYKMLQKSFSSLLLHLFQCERSLRRHDVNTATTCYEDMICHENGAGRILASMRLEVHWTWKLSESFAG